ncbi:MAG TPA: propanediol utilization protein [Elusimicrobia bacterium]|nr:propanediol utilization protein [Elusimicrobiota bacterium]
MKNAIGGVELSSMAKGFEAADAMLKASSVELVLSRTICPGKYAVLVAGDVADVRASVEAGVARAAESHVDSFLIPNLHPDVFPAIAGTSGVSKLEALGIVETFSIASLIEAADAAVKAASVKLIEVRLAMAMGGKAFVTFTGSVADVETAAMVAAASAGEKGLLVQKVVIPQPRPELLTELI